MISISTQKIIKFKNIDIYFIFEYLKSLNYIIFLNVALKFQFLTNFYKIGQKITNLDTLAMDIKKVTNVVGKIQNTHLEKGIILKIRPLMIIQPFIILDVRITFTCVWYDLTMSYINLWLIPTIIGILVPILFFFKQYKKQNTLKNPFFSE